MTCFGNYLCLSELISWNIEALEQKKNPDAIRVSLQQRVKIKLKLKNNKMSIDAIV
jgi:hypothetical protein